MKAILVIDMPSSCSMCKANRICKVWLESNSLSPTWKGFDDILDGCPLKPIPQKMSTDGDDIEENSYFLGWNECIEELEK